MSRAFIFALLVLLSPAHILAKDGFGRPQLAVSGSTLKLSVAFSDPSQWDGKRVPRTMQCPRLGGQDPASPGLNVTNIPEATKSLVMFINNVRAYDNHGLVRITDGRDGTTWTIPPLRSRAPVAALPQGIELFDGGNMNGGAYAAPCPPGGSWQYIITVYALGEKDEVLALGEISMGWAP